jgi:uncharacterized damage-inducible protein DinB
MPTALDQQELLLNAWRTNNRVTIFLFENLPPELWAAAVPGAPRRTVRMIAGHVHNARCMWIKTLGQEHGVAVPRVVNRTRPKQPRNSQLAKAWVRKRRHNPELLILQLA